MPSTFCMVTDSVEFEHLLKRNLCKNIQILKTDWDINLTLVLFTKFVPKQLKIYNIIIYKSI